MACLCSGAFYSPRPSCLCPKRPVEVRMDKFANAMMQNLPEMLARDLAEQEDVFIARSMTSGGPSVELAFENQPPNVPQRNPSRVLHRLYQVSPETFLCPLRQDNVESAWRSEREAILKSAAYASTHPSSRTPRRDQTSASKQAHMKKEADQEPRRHFLNGLDEGWGSDSSVDFEAGLSSPSFRTRKQSITTAATSIDLPQYCGEKGAEAYSTGPCYVGGSPAVTEPTSGYTTRAFTAEDYPIRGRAKEVLVHSPTNHAAWQGNNDAGSWVDLGHHENLPAGFRMPGFSRGVESSSNSRKLDKICPTPHTTYSMDDDRSGLYQQEQPPLDVPERRSSLSHKVTTLVPPNEMMDSPKSPTHILAEEISPPLLPSPPPSPRQFPAHHPAQFAWNATEAALGPVIPTGRHQPRQELQLDLSSLPTDELSLPPLSATETNPHDRTYSLRSQQQQPNMLSKPRKSHSISRMPRRNVHHWLESNSRARQHSPPPPLPVTSPIAMSPTSSVRVSGPILEALRINVQNFPDTMLRTSSITIGQIRDYSHKLKRSNATRQLVPNRESDDHFTAASDTPTPPISPNLGRKGSFGNLKLVNSLRGKFSRFNSSTSASSINEQAESNWSPSDDTTTTASMHSDSTPLRPSAARDAACVNALRCILPHGTPYLLDALYAHIIAYNYIDSVCGASPQPQHNASGSYLRSRPSQNALLPSGVTSLADLRVQENVSETIVKEFQDDVASVASRSVVPSKAASLLGLGSTNMANPIKPVAGHVGGRDTKHGKASAPGTAKSHYLESDSAMRSLREDIAHNIYRLVETVKTSSTAEGVDSEETQDGSIVPNGKRLDDMLMRALSELVRCYEELSC